MQRERTSEIMHLPRQQPRVTILSDLIPQHRDRIDADIEAGPPQPAVVGQKIPLLGKHEIGELP
jgi:hypothetical protein